MSGDDVVNVLEGDSVTLKPDNNVPLKKEDLILWKFNGNLISKMNKTDEDLNIITTDTGKKFSGRLEPDKKTGSLKITDIRTEHAGIYKVEMKTITETSKSYSVTVHGE